MEHPNIDTLNDIGENYMVMELIEKETLADRVSREASPREKALT